MCKKCVINKHDDSEFIDYVFDGEGNEIIDRKCKCICSESENMLELNDPPFISQTYAGESVPYCPTFVCNHCQHGV